MRVENSFAFDGYLHAVCGGLFLFAVFVFVAPVFFTRHASTLASVSAAVVPTVAAAPADTEPRAVPAPNPSAPKPTEEIAPPPPPVSSAGFLYTFNTDGILLEKGRMERSSSPYFWVTSGGKLVITSGLGGTLHGKLAADDPIRLQYKTMNPLDTTEGYYPQNTFRLVTKDSWQNYVATIRFRIDATNLANTPNRDGYSGFFLMGRYADQHNLYYVGVRHDGQAVIKKKIDGTYYTLAEKQLFGAQTDYHKWQHPNLLPQGEWMALRATFENLASGVRVTMYLDRTNGGTFSEVLSVIDTGIGGPAHARSGLVGIRSDYMDVSFDTYELNSQ